MIGVVSRGFLKDGGGGFVSPPVISNVTEFPDDYESLRVIPWECDLTEFPDGTEVVIHVHYVNRNETYVARSAAGARSWPFDVIADNDVTGVDDERHIKILPRGGWPPCDVEIEIAAGLVATE